MKILFTAKEENWDSPIDHRFGRANMFRVPLNLYTLIAFK